MTLTHHHEHHNQKNICDHGHQSSSNILLALILNIVFVFIELFGAWWTNSMSIYADSLHDIGDIIAIGLAYLLEKKALQKRDNTYSYGYKRFSLLGAFINSMILIFGSCIIVWHSSQRLFHNEIILPDGMIVLAFIGILINGFGAWRVRKKHSINEEAIHLHLLEDVFGWVIILLGAISIKLFNLPQIDTYVAIIFACLVLYRAVQLLKKTSSIFLQRIPDNLDIELIKKRILSIPKIKSVHDLHIWSLNGNHNILTAHIVLAKKISHTEALNIKRLVKNLLKEMLIEHSTIEIEEDNEVCLDTHLSF